MKAIYGKEDVVHGEKLLCVEGEIVNGKIILIAGNIYIADRPSDGGGSFLRIMNPVDNVNGWRYNRFIPLRYLLEE